MALPFLISAIIIPLIGMAIDKYGKRTYLLIIAAFFGIITHILFICVNPIYPLILMGISYSLFAAVLWPCVSIILPKEIVGIAFGFAMSLQNLGLVFVPIIIASIFTNTGSYDMTLLFFIFILISALVLAFFIHFEDQKNKRLLNSVVGLDNKDMNYSSSIIRQNSFIMNNEEETRLLKIKTLI